MSPDEKSCQQSRKGNKYIISNKKKASLALNRIRTLNWGF